MMIKQITLGNWKNFQEATVGLRERNFLIGPNASGKSNFLDAFRFLKDVSSSKGGGLAQAVEARGGLKALRCVHARRRSSVLISIDLAATPMEETQWSYLLEITETGGRPEVVREIVKQRGAGILHRPNDEDIADRERLSQTALEQVSENQRFRPISDFLKSINYRHLIPQAIRDPAGFSPHQISDDPFGRDFLQKVEQTPKKTRDSRLKKIEKALKIAVPQLSTLEVKRDKAGTPHLSGKFEHWRPQGVYQDETQFSDGTLRLFGLLWTLLEANGPLLMEEPELSLHSAIVGHLPDLMENVLRKKKGDRPQLFISTHSEEMLLNKSIGGEEVLRLEVGSEGTVIKNEPETEGERRLLAEGFSVGEVLIRKSDPPNIQQLFSWGR
jgi:predicted ATPase